MVPAPRSLPRVVRLPDELTEGKEHHVMLSSIIHTHVSDLFPGMTATGCYQFRVTRNADLTLTEDVEDLAEALKDELSSRRFGRAVRLEVNKIVQHIFMNTYSKNSIWIRINCIVSTYVNLARLVSDFKRPYLRYEPHTPVIPKILKNLQIFSVRCRNKIFYCIILLNHFPL